MVIRGASWVTPDCAPDGRSRIEDKYSRLLSEWNVAFWHIAAPDVCDGTTAVGGSGCATARPQLAKADTALQAHPLVNRLNLA